MWSPYHIITNIICSECIILLSHKICPENVSTNSCYRLHFMKWLVFEVSTSLFSKISFSTVHFVAGPCPGIFTQQLDNTTFNFIKKNTVEVVTTYTQPHVTTISNNLCYLSRMRNIPISSFPNRLAVNFRHTQYFYIVKIKTESLLNTDLVSSLTLCRLARHWRWRSRLDSLRSKVLKWPSVQESRLVLSPRT